MQRHRIPGNSQNRSSVSPGPSNRACMSCASASDLKRLLWEDSNDKHRPTSLGTTVSRLYSGSCVFTVLRTLALVVFYYCFSIGITFYQKWFIKDFHFPLTVVICHLVVKFVLSALCRFVHELCTGQPRVLLEWSTYIKKLSITGIASSLDIGLSNWSFEFITVSLYTMTKSTCIIFILGFSLLFGLERKHVSLVGVVLLISAGLFMFTYKSVQFNLMGFLLVLGASFLSGLRWTLAQLVMQRKDIGLSNPLDMIYHIQPWMILGLLPLAVCFEGIPIATSEKMFRFKDYRVILHNTSLILFGSVLAFLMELSEYLLLTYTSSLTLSIAGIFKEMCTMYLAVNLNGDQMTYTNFIGLVVCLLGISLHMLFKLFTQTDEPASFGSETPEHSHWLLSQEDEEDVLYDVLPVR